MPSEVEASMDTLEAEKEREYEVGCIGWRTVCTSLYYLYLACVVLVGSAFHGLLGRRINGSGRTNPGNSVFQPPMQITIKVPNKQSKE